MPNLEKIFKALANRRRILIIRFLKKNDEATVAQIAGMLSLSFRATSRHLLKLAACDILERNQRNVCAYYRLTREPDSKIQKILSEI